MGSLQGPLYAEFLDLYGSLGDGGNVQFCRGLAQWVIK